MNDAPNTRRFLLNNQALLLLASCEEPTSYSPVQFLGSTSSLESLVLEGSGFTDADLRNMAHLSGLKSLSLRYTNIGDAGLAELASLRSIEELAIYDPPPSAAAIESLAALRGLKRLHIGDRFAESGIDLDQGTLPAADVDLDRYAQALRRLRQSNPEIVIDSDEFGLSWHNQLRIPTFYTRIPEWPRSNVLYLLREQKRLGPLGWISDFGPNK